MKIKQKVNFFAAALILSLPLFAFAQKTAQSAKLLTRITTKTEKARLGVGGTLTILGAPEGSITIEAWREPQVEISAEIEVKAASEDDLTLLAQANNFAVDAEMNHVRVVTTGTHDKNFLKKNFKNFPKRLLNAAWRADYRIKVPPFCDLEINTGRGRLNLNGVEGVIIIKAAEAEADLNLIGGAVQATFGGGSVRVRFNSRSWRGAGAEIQLARGAMTVELPANLNADVDADVLRTGRIENLFPAFKPRDDSKFSDRSMQARAGAGGARFVFTVGDGELKLAPQP